MEEREEESRSRMREIADSCRLQQWSVAIRLLSSLPGLSSSAILLCNRAHCYSKLELYKHVLKDCNRALVLNSCTLQAYLYKGQALIAMGKHKEGAIVWQHGYEVGLGQPSDLEMLLQLHSLAMQTILIGGVNTGSLNSPSGLVRNEELKEALGNMTVNNRGVAQKEMSDRRDSRPFQASSIRVDRNLARGIAQVNAGNYEEAVEVLSVLIKENLSPEALVGRGTAYVFLQQLPAAIDDFSKAIEQDPSFVEAWKRRGQARAAVSLNLEAIADLSKAIELNPKAPETLYERGVIYYKVKDFESAINDLRASLALDSMNQYAYNYYGLALTSIGEYSEAMAAYCKVVELDPCLKEAWMHLAKLYKDLGDSRKSLECLQKVLTMDAKCLGVWRMVAVGLRSHLEVGYTFHSRFVHARRLKALLLYSLGDHRGAVKELTIGLEVEPQNSDLLYLRGSCYNAIGNYGDAVKDYDGVLYADVTPGESSTLQILAFYQREIALYSVLKIGKPFKEWDIDNDLDPRFKEAWCKRLSPMVLFPAYNCQPLPEVLFSHGTLKPEDKVLTQSRKILLDTADRLGHLIQCNCPGFLKNARQHRMAGLAVLDIAQNVASALQRFRIDKVQGEGSIQIRAEKTEKSIEEHFLNVSVVPTDRTTMVRPACTTQEAHQSNHQGLNWRDLYSIAVKWRQASEPCDPVVWVDMLSEKEYEAGFGAHTPMLLGQHKVVRYYPNFPRAFMVAKGLILERGHVFNSANRPVDLLDPMQLLAVDAAANCSEMYDVVGEDFWLVTPCHSTAAGGKILDGTRFTLQKLGMNGYDFSIRTPCTPPRWADYDEELTAAWQDYWNIYCERDEVVDNSQLVKQLKDCILRLSFYWYNFMPLARGTAVVGYVMLLALFLAADMEVTASIPKGLQVDWEAILSPDPNMFMKSTQSWLYPSVKLNKSWQDLPSVSETFATFGAAIAALGSP